MLYGGWWLVVMMLSPPHTAPWRLGVFNLVPLAAYLATRQKAPDFARLVLYGAVAFAVLQLGLFLICSS
jgi:hypothetical protein